MNKILSTDHMLYFNNLYEIFPSAFSAHTHTHTHTHTLFIKKLALN